MVRQHFFFLHQLCVLIFGKEGSVMTNFLISVFGFLIVDRILYRLEIFNYISSPNRKKFLIFSLFTYVLFSIFKDLIVVNMSLFGIFLGFLMFFYIFHEKKLQTLFENRHKSLIDELILIIQTGCSPIKALDDVMNTFSVYEKKVFWPLNTLLGSQQQFSRVSGTINHNYFIELIEILQQKSRVIDQLDTFRNSLQIQIKLRRKSRTVTAASKAQAIVAVLIYFVFLTISWMQFNLQDYPRVLMTSVVLLVLGLLMIFKMGNRIKWTI